MSDFEIPFVIRKMVEDGVLEETPMGTDCPAFCAGFQDDRRRRLWACLWIESTDHEARHTWPARFTLTVQPDPVVMFGRRVCSTDDLAEVLARLKDLLKGGLKDKQGRFKILPAEGA